MLREVGQLAQRHTAKNILALLILCHIAPPSSHPPPVFLTGSYQLCRPQAGLTSICIGLSAIAVLQAIVPGALILGTAAAALPSSVTSLEAVRPLALVEPAPLGLYAQPMPFALAPVSLEGVPTGPGVDAGHFKAKVPGARVFALALGARAQSVSVGLSPLPAPAVCPAIIKVKAAPTHLIVAPDSLTVLQLGGERAMRGASDVLRAHSGLGAPDSPLCPRREKARCHQRLNEPRSQVSTGSAGQCHAWEAPTQPARGRLPVGKEAGGEDSKSP